MSSPEDARLLERLSKGDERALRELVARHQRLVFGLCSRMLGSEQDAEEVASETFVRLWRGASTFRGDCSVKALLCTIAMNACRDRLKARRPTEPLSENLCLEGAAEDERLEKIETAMGRLDMEERELLTLYYLRELSYEEIGGALGVSYEVLRTRLVRARKKLRMILGIEE